MAPPPQRDPSRSLDDTITDARNRLTVAGFADNSVVGRIRTRREGFAHTERLAGNGAEPAYVTRPENFTGMSHDTIWNGIQELTPDSLNVAANSWGKISTALQADIDTFARAMSTGFHGWSGDAKGAAAAAQAHVKKMSDLAGELDIVIWSVQHRLATASEGAATVTHDVPPPLPPFAQLTGTAKALDMGKAEQAYNTLATELEHEAQRVMNGVYVPTVHPTGTGVPRFGPAPAAPENSAAPTHPSAPPSGPTGAGPDARNQSGSDGQQNAGQPNQAGSQHDPAGGDARPVDNEHASHDGPATDHTTSAGARPDDDMSRPRPGSGSGPSAGGSGGSLGPSLDGDQRPAANLPAAPLTGSTLTDRNGPTAKAGATTSRPGTSGAPGMGAPGAPGKKPEEKTHTSADYLRGTHHLEAYLEDIHGRKLLPGGVLAAWSEDEEEPEDT